MPKGCAMNAKYTFGAYLRLAFAFIWLVTVTAGAYSAQTLQKINQSGCTKLELSVKNEKPVNAEICSAQVTEAYPYKGAFLWGGDVGELPGSVVISIHVFADDKNILVPLSAYSDLGDVHYASLEASDKGFSLNLHGGETATGYDAKLEFENGHLVSRDIESREFPQQVKETTKYLFLKSDGNI
jgi:hypothetical protein